MRTLLKNGIVIREQNEWLDVLIDDGIIIDLLPSISDQDASVIDCTKMTIAPGFIDMHMHLREPGFEHKETIATGTKAAARGGYTTICPMPNTKPVCDNLKQLNAFMNKVKTDACVHVLPYASITTSLSDHGEIVDMEALIDQVAGFSNDGVGIQAADLMYKAMQKASSLEALIAAHCEDEKLLFGGIVHKGVRSESNGWMAMTSLPETLQIARDILIAEETNARYHVCHISTKEGVRIVREAKERNQKVTCEVTPHHLLLENRDVDNSDFKMNPPLRGVDDKYALIQALIEGTIDCVATDHAPHAPSEKAQGMEKAPFGVVGLETAFPLIYTNLVRTRMASLQQAIAWFSLNPAKILNLEAGRIVKGRVADLVILDLNKKRKIDKNTFFSKGRNTPFDGWECSGWPVMTLVEGKVAFQDESFGRSK
ncbi:MAG: dihydroorotase [Candidatus Izemoplasmatales bacterium]|nr:dihydroorotase [Candidatus Izemoplasmatales bacterium]MDD4355004.1 dihydroorotase [Candidatus Izemoplasmatales bacterium]MDD4987828.1 dihydroorotase [Candidatus Izemoplasmatales bacterium]MDY0372665.1 dihydroorotase [Candidatus Izemoplasmatales bacterium]NLF49382.1 dihydroorotase [Acholeplasmataceae bacterium]